MARGGGQVVSDDPSLHPTEIYNLNCVKLDEKTTEKKQKRGQEWLELKMI